MPHVGEPAGAAPPGHDEPKCPFCETKTLLNYHTKHGVLKDEKVLAKSLATDGEIKTDKEVGTIYPLPGGNDKTTGWEAKEGTLEDFAVKMAAAPHHIIPGNAAMAPSRVEKWTVESKGKIKQDIGYSIDCAQNGIFLPHLPEIYFTRRISGKPMSKYYGQTWAGLSDSAKASIAATVQMEVCLQMHYTDHDDPYVHVDHSTTYDGECKQLCNQLADYMDLKAAQCPKKDGDGKLMPPYGLVLMLNQKSARMKDQITGIPSKWRSWVSPLAQNLTQDLRTGKLRFGMRGLVHRLTS